MDDDSYEVELRRRLTILEDPAYEDPASADLPRTDLLLLAIGVVVVVVVMWVWGYPG